MTFKMALGRRSVQRVLQQLASLTLTAEAGASQQLQQRLASGLLPAAAAGHVSAKSALGHISGLKTLANAAAVASRTRGVAPFGSFSAGGLLSLRRASTAAVNRSTISNSGSKPSGEQQAAGTRSLQTVTQDLDDLPVVDRKVTKAQKVLKALSAAEFRQVLEKEAETRPDVSFAEWEALCAKTGAANSKDSAVELLEAMETAGVVLHFQERVYLKPAEIAESILGALYRDFPASQADVANLAAQLSELEGKKEEAEQQASKRAGWFLWGTAAVMFAQFAAFSYMTFGDNQPGWEVMEPVTFYWFYFNGLVCYMYFLLTRQEFSWEGFRDKLLSKELERYAKTQNLDLTQYERLVKRVQRHKHVLHRVRA